MEKSKLLIIDDDEALCESLIDILELEDYLVDSSYNAEDGIKKIEESFCNIVLLDMKLPDSDGIVVLKKIKEISPDTEVIIFTAYAEMDIVIKAMDRNAFSFLPKPYEIPYLITTIKRAREKQRITFENRILYQQTVRAEKDWEDTFDAISDLISIHDKDFNLIRCNRAVADKLNIKPEDIIGKKCYEAFHGRNEPWPACPFVVRCKESLKPESEEGEWMGGIFLMSCFPRFDEAGKFNGIVHIARDITERKKAEELVTSLGYILENSLNEIYIFDADTLKFIQVNKGAKNNMGYSIEELKKITPLDIKPEFTRESFEKQIEPLRSGEKEMMVFETVHQRKDGSLYNVEVHLQLSTFESSPAFVAIILDITKRKQVEDSLQKSEEKFRAIFDNTFQFIGLLKPDGTIIESNRGALDFAGIKLSDVFNKPFWETPWWSHSETLQRLLQKSIRMASQGNFVRFEATHLKQDGTLAYIDISLTPVKDKDGNVIFIIPEGRDITELKQIEEKVHMLSQAVEQSPATVIITDKGGNIEYVNQKFSKISGYDYSEVIGKNPRVLKSGEKPLEEYSELWKTITSGNEWRGEFHNKKKSGELYWEYASISPIRNQEGDITHFLAVKEDITERKKAEQALLESEEKFRTISTTAHEAIIMSDDKGTISYWNEAAERIFGYSAEEAVGKGLHETIVPEKYREEHMKGFDKFKDSGKGAFIEKTFETSAQKKDGTVFPIDISITAVKLKDKWCAIGIIRDITERLRSEELLRINYKMASLGRLTAGVFHEILNPVNIISSHIQLLLMEAEKGSKIEEDLKSIQEEIARIVKISDSLLRFSRKGGPGSEKIGMNDLLERTISLLEPDMKLENVRFVRKFADSLPLIAANSDQLRQVFLNLITNARDAMPEGGTITVSTENITGGEVPFVRIKTTDTGCGIDKENIQMIFDPFFTTKTEGKGTGLGLSTSYGIIEGHGGVLSVESQVGKGTTFTIDLPC